MTVIASSILTRVRTQLADTGSVQRWTDAELLSWLSDGQRAIVSAVSNATQMTSSVNLGQGTRQSIPAGGHMLLDVYRNLSPYGIPGPALNYVDREVLDNQYPNWHELPQVAQPLFWTYDELDPAAFYVYPPAQQGAALEINYSYMPPDLASTASPIVVRDIFETPLVDYVLYRAHSKDADYAAGMQRAAGYLQAFSSGIAPLVPKK